MTNTREPEVNKALAKVLEEVIAGGADGEYKGWKVEPERWVPLKWKCNEDGSKISVDEGIKKKPDIVVKPAVPGLELIIETGFDSAKNVEEDAQRRLKQGLELYPGEPAICVKQVIALCLEDRFKKVPKGMLENDIRGGRYNFFMCLHRRGIVTPRVPKDKWAVVNLIDLETIIKDITTSPTVGQLSAEVYIKQLRQVIL